MAEMGLRNTEQNLFRYDADILSGYSREVRVVAEINGVPQGRTTKNGLSAGTYVQPINVWVHGEQVIPGTAPPPNDFSDMPWLTRGVGADENGNIWGPLDPFPQSGVLIDVPVCDNAVVSIAGGNDAEPSFTPSGKSTIPLSRLQPTLAKFTGQLH